LNDEEQ
jgi:hypothetical protein